jgi:hypothetical protein
MNYEILAENILHFPNLIELPESYVSFCNEETDKEGIPTDQWVARGDTSEYVYGEMWELPRSNDSEKVQNLLNLYDKALYSACEGFMEYRKVEQQSIDATIEKLKNNKMPAITVKRYFEGERLGLHPDVDPSNTDDVLYLTISFYYNDDYVGGELGFDGGARVKPTPGSVVIFPSKYFHESLTVSSGIKYVSNEVVKVDSRFIKGA